MRKLRLTVWVMILVLLAACTPQGGEVNRPDKTSEQSPHEVGTAESIETEMAAEAATTQAVDPLPTGIATPIDKNVPDIAADSAEKANSSYMLYEDTDNIYYLWKGNGLYCINKSNGTAAIISGGCSCFTAYNGLLYFIEETNELKQYNCTENSIKPIIAVESEINSLACADNKIYFTCKADIDSNENGDILFSADLNGNNQVKLHDNVDTFCFYNDRVFSITLGELGYIQEYTPDNTGNKKRLSNRSVYRNFDISFDKIICAEFKDDVFNCSNNLAYDISTGKTNNLPIAYAEYAIKGQYIIYIEEDVTNEQIVMKAYDFIADKAYKLLDISDISDPNCSIEIHTTRDNIYLCIEKDSKELDIFKVIIENGQARLEHIALINGIG